MTDKVRILMKLSLWLMMMKVICTWWSCNIQLM